MLRCSPSSPTSRVALASVVTVLALLAAACGSGDSSESTAGGSEEGSSLDWTACEDGYECADLVVPRDHTDPDSPTFTIPVIRLPATGPGERIGSLVVNPGGPGISGVNYLRDEGASLAALGERYDLVSFDPRGAGASNPAVDCLSEEEVATVRDQVSAPSTPAEERVAVDSAESMAQACADQVGEWLPWVGTQEVARDMDLLRAELGDDQLTYLGFSYGTFLGATYADLFPENTRRMVLDGAMDPARDYDTLRHDQAVAMDAALRRFAADCLESSDCPLTGSVDDALAQLAGIVEALDRSPFTADDGRTLSGSRALALIQSATYYPPSTWDGLRGVLGDALDGQYDAMLELAYGPALMVNPADTPYLSVMCHDLATSDGDLGDLADEWAVEAPLNGPSRAWSTLPCRVWPEHTETPSTALNAEGSGPILVVGTTHDPATPVAWARSLSGALDEASYLEWEGDGHIAYGRAGACVSDIVEGFLLEDEAPPATSTCQ